MVLLYCAGISPLNLSQKETYNADEIRKISDKIKKARRLKTLLLMRDFIKFLIVPI